MEMGTSQLAEDSRVWQPNSPQLAQTLTKQNRAIALRSTVSFHDEGTLKHKKKHIHRRNHGKLIPISKSLLITHFKLLVFSTYVFLFVRQFASLI